jgi:hypothetical protein
VLSLSRNKIVSAHMCIRCKGQNQISLYNKAEACIWCTGPLERQKIVRFVKRMLTQQTWRVLMISVSYPTTEVDADLLRNVGNPPTNPKSPSTSSPPSYNLSYMSTRDFQTRGNTPSFVTCRGSSVSVVSDYGLDERGSISDRGKEFFF